MDRIDVEFELRVCNAMEEVKAKAIEQKLFSDFELLNYEIEKRVSEIRKSYNAEFIDGKWVIPELFKKRIVANKKGVTIAYSQPIPLKNGNWISYFFHVYENQFAHDSDYDVFRKTKDECENGIDEEIKDFLNYDC